MRQRPDGVEQDDSREHDHPESYAVNYFAQFENHIPFPAVVRANGQPLRIDLLVYRERKVSIQSIFQSNFRAYFTAVLAFGRATAYISFMIRSRRPPSYRLK